MSSKEEKKACKLGLLGRTVLYGTLICALPFVSVTTSYADASTFIGSDDTVEGQTGCDNTKNPPVENSYSLIIGGRSVKSTDGTTEASRNILTLTKDHKLYLNIEIYGGIAVSAESKNVTASGNTIDINETVIGKSRAPIYGGYVLSVSTSEDLTAITNNNKITINLDKTVSNKIGILENCSNIVNGSGVAYASSNTITLVNGDYSSIYAGRAINNKGQAFASQNNGTFTDINAGNFFGGFADITKSGTAEALKNIFTVTGGSYTNVVGGGARIQEGVIGSKAIASSNDITVSKSNIKSNIFGGQARVISSGDAFSEKNKLMLEDAEITGTVWGGYAQVNGTGSAKSEGNSLKIYGGTYTGSIYAGYSSVTGEGTASSAGNTVSLYAYEGTGPKFDEEKTVIWGGYAAKGGTEVACSGNTLEFHEVQGLSAANIKNFDSLTFELPDIKADAVVLTLTGKDADEGTGTTDLSGATVNVQTISALAGADGGEFKVGDKVYLLKNSNGIETKDSSLNTVNYQVGSTIEYILKVETDGDDATNATSVYLTRTGTRVQPGAKALAEGSAAGLALVNEAANAGIELARTFAPQTGIIAPFAHVQGSSVTHETGSHVSLNSLSLVAGLGTGIDTGAGKLSAGAFFEYGTGSYTTSNSFDNAPDVDGDGNSWYMGGGILAKMEFVPTGPGHFYVEGSAHMGSLHNEYDTSDLRDRYGRSAGFDMDSPYYSLHGGIGYVWNITEDHDLDIFGKYIWTRVQGDDETLTTGDKFEFDDMDSSRLRFGARYSYKGSERFQPYVGVAYEHEFAGSCDARTFGYSIAAPSFEGDTGIGELGLTMTPSETLPLSINLGVQGYVGQKRGVSGNFMAKYEF